MKLDLDKTYLHGGKYYGPGKGVEVPDDAAKDIQARIEAASAAVVQTDSTSAGAQHEADQGKATAANDDETSTRKASSKKGK